MIASTDSDNDIDKDYLRIKDLYFSTNSAIRLLKHDQ